MKIILRCNAILLIGLLFFSNYCFADDLQQMLGIEKVCAGKNLDVNNKQLCSAELLQKATYVDKKLALQASNLKNYKMLKDLYLTVLKFKADRSICNLYKEDNYVNCIDKALDKASADVDVKNNEINNLNAAELIKSAKLNIGAILNAKLDELNVCRLGYANKLDDNISAVADIASAVQSKCNYLAYEFYDYHLLLDLSIAYDIFAEDYFDVATKQKFLNDAVEKHFGQQATVGLVLEQRANRKESLIKNKKSKTDKKVNI